MFLFKVAMLPHVIYPILQDPMAIYFLMQSSMIVAGKCIHIYYMYTVASIYKPRSWPPPHVV